MVDHAEVSIKDYAGDIWDQGSDSICHCVAVADTVTIMYRLLGFEDLKLSPKILIDARCGNIEDAGKIICNPDLGLQSVCDYQVMFPRTPYLKIEYQEGLRYWIDGLVNHFGLGQIKHIITHNFSELGRKFPLLATVVMGEFAKFDVSLNAFETPFRHNLSDEEYEELLDKEDPHCLIIVGANFSSEDISEHYCVVKNSYGEGWGLNGFSKVAPEMVLRLTQPLLSEQNTSRVTWNEKRTWKDEKLTLSERSSVSGQHDTHMFDHETMESASPSHGLLENNSNKMKRTLLVSNLRSHTRKSEIYDYFTGLLRAEVTDIVLNSWKNGWYNNSCLVTFSSSMDAKKVRKMCDHQIDGVKVTVKRYRGKEQHPKVFQRGKHDLLIKGTNEIYMLHRQLEDICVRCGPQSGMDFLRSEDDGLCNGEVVITFYKESHRQMALDILRKEYHLEACLLTSDDQVNED